MIRRRQLHRERETQTKNNAEDGEIERKESTYCNGRTLKPDPCSIKALLGPSKLETPSLLIRWITSSLTVPLTFCSSLTPPSPLVQCCFSLSPFHSLYLPAPPRLHLSDSTAACRWRKMREMENEREREMGVN